MAKTIQNPHRLANSGAITRAANHTHHERPFGAVVATLLILAAIVVAIVAGGACSAMPAAAATEGLATPTDLAPPTTAPDPLRSPLLIHNTPAPTAVVLVATVAPRATIAVAMDHRAFMPAMANSYAAPIVAPGCNSEVPTCNNINTN